ncbi:MAG: hypothetical protein ACRDHM_07960 [Actinomycetota bacterium]
MRRLLDLLTDERLEAVLMRLIVDAARGDAGARKMLLEYTLGKASASAPTPTEIAVEDEAGVDPLARDIFLTMLEGPS